MALLIRKENIEYQPHPKFKGVTVAMLAGKATGLGVGVSILELSQGVEIPVHTHDESLDSIYCLAGEGQIYHQGNWKPFGQGDYCLVPPGEEHGVKSGDKGRMRLFIVHRPPLF